MKSSCVFFDHYREKWRTCRVRLCGVHRKNIWGAANLHKLPGKSRKTVMNQSCPVKKGYLCRKEELFPVHKEAADDVTAVALINIGIVIHECILAFPAFLTGDDFYMFRQGYL